MVTYVESTGLPQDLFPEYKTYFDYTLKEFCSKHSPCRHKSCANVQQSHVKGHQNQRGKIIAVGEYESEFSYEDYYNPWMADVLHDIKSLQSLESANKRSDNRGRAIPDAVLALNQHVEILIQFYARAKLQSQFESQSTCVLCFMESSEHALPCGHVLCTPCVKGLGKKMSKTEYRLKSCPVHTKKSRTKWENPHVIRFKPKFAGVRLLSLDGYVKDFLAYREFHYLLCPLQVCRYFFNRANNQHQ
jgi:hypothetical protein